MIQNPVVEFLFAPGSRYSYLASSQIAHLEHETGCKVDWRPVNGGDIRALRGRDPFSGEAISGQYDWTYREHDARQWANFYGIPFREPPSHHFDFRLLSRAAMAAKILGKASTYGLKICEVVFGKDVWPIDEAVCVSLAVDIGIDESAFRAALHDPQTESTLISTAEEAFRRGAFGVPTFFVGSQMFWGNDRLPLLKHHLKMQGAS